MKKVLPHIVVFLLVAGVYLGGLLAPVDRALLDLRFHLTQSDASGDIVIVGIDSRSLKRFDVWPWPRRFHAALLENLAAAGARRVAFDIDFSSRSNAEDDRILAGAFERSKIPIILPAFKQLVRGDGAAPRLSYTAPNALFAEHVRIATVNIRVDGDGKLRRYLTSDRLEDLAVHSMASALATDELLPPAEFIVDFGIRPHTIPRLSYADVVEGRFDPAVVRGRTVIVGATAVELGDQFSAPRSGVVSGPLFQAMAFESLVQGRTLFGATELVVLAVTLIMAAFLGPLFGRWSWRIGLAILGGAVAFALAAPLAIQRGLPLSVDSAAWMLAPLLSYAYSLWRQIDEQAYSIFRHRLEALHRRAMMNSVVDDSFNGIVIANQDGLVEMMTRSAGQILGCDAAAASDAAVHTFIPSSPEIQELYDRDRSGGTGAVGANMAGPLQFEIGAGDDARVIEMIVSSSRLNVSRHLLERRRFDRTVYIYTFQDITARKRAEEAQIRATEQAEAANRAKTEFLATMSHELRTPLNAVIGFSEIMKTEALGPLGTPQYKEYMEDIHASGAHLLAVINDILDMSRIEAGEMKPAEERMEIARVVNAAVRLIAERATKGRVALKADLPADLPSLYADERMIKQILLNLLSNAVKFTPEGGRVTTGATVQTDGGISLWVADTGIGIAAEHMEVILQPFGQADSRLERKYEGTGLGLPLVKAMVELHDGTLEIASAKGEGTTVTAHFPPIRAVRKEKVA
jgi:signal transduction histidine kinase/CHASE2 domain-containing sensor protein